jgi:hypothetical protein
VVERAKKDSGVVVCVVDVAEYEVDVDATENVFRQDRCNAQEPRREKAVADFSSLLLP